MISVAPYTKDTVFPQDVDHIFDQMKHYSKLIPYCYPKLHGVWKIVLVGFSIEEIRAVISDDVPKHVYVYIYSSKDVVSKVLLEYPTLGEVKKSRWALYLEEISKLSVGIDKSASKEFFKRTNGNLELVRETIPKLIDMLEGTEDTIQLKHLNRVLLKENHFYARDLLLTILLRNNVHVKRKGSMYSKYKFMSFEKVYESLMISMGRDFLFYSLRKYTKHLYEQKMLYLDNKDVKEIDLIKILDVYEIIHAYESFQLSNPKQLLTVLKVVEGRTQGVNLFKDTILTHY